MKNLTATIFAILFALSLISEALAQDAKDSPVKTATSPAGSARDEPKGEVDAAVEELKKRGEGLITMVGEKEAANANDKIKGGVINGRAIQLVPPAYPAIARASRASGQVVVLVLIDKEGRVTAAQVVDGHPLLRAAAINAARASRFTPTQLDGKPVNVMGQIVYNFVAVNP